MEIVLKLDHKLQELGISQHELNRMTGIRQPTINQMCRNNTQHLPLKNLALICEVLDCEITDILELKKESD